MRISARNQFLGTVAAIREGAVNGVVTIDLGGPLIKADITMDAIRDLGIAEGVRATAVVKANNVLFASGTQRLPISARNQYVGTVSRVARGAVNSQVSLVTPEGLTFQGSITCEAVEELGLAEGAHAVAIVKSSDVMVAVED